jgi:two-component system response regulator BaeR
MMEQSRRAHLEPLSSPTNIAAQRILIVEDDEILAQILVDALSAAGYLPLRLADGSAVIDWVRRTQPSAVLLDLGLPGQHGFSVCRELRAISTVPLIMITGQVDELDRLLGLELGADDYICKPFVVREVVARVRALLRRSQGWHAQGVTPLLLDADKLSAHWQGRALSLTAVEFRLLERLARRPGQVLSRTQLLDALHADERAINDRTIDSHIKNLRRKMRTITPDYDPVESVYGVGYKLISR